MHLWTIQPPEVYRLVMDTGVYRCDPFQNGMLQSFDESKIGNELDQQFAESYDWLVRQMEKRIGPRPEGVIYPVWAWYQFAYQKKPDLRRERWSNGNPGEKQACILLDVPDREVLLSDFGNWHHVLNHWPITDTEAESERVDAYIETLSEKEKTTFLSENWERVFDIEPFANGWTSRGADIQATFWELKRVYIQDVRFFTGGRRGANGKIMRDEDIGWN